MFKALQNPLIALHFRTMKRIRWQKLPISHLSLLKLEKKWRLALARYNRKREGKKSSHCQPKMIWNRCYKSWRWQRRREMPQEQKWSHCGGHLLWWTTYHRMKMSCRGWLGFIAFKIGRAWSQKHQIALKRMQRDQAYHENSSKPPWRDSRMQVLKEEANGRKV